MDQKAAQDFIAQKMARYWDGTEGWLRFMQDELKYKPDACLLGVVDNVANKRDTALRSSHGVGKTTLSANLLLTALGLVPELLVFQISPTWSQVKGIFWNELRTWYNKSPYMREVFKMADKSPKIWCRYAEHVWYSEGKASNSPGRIEGKHAKRVFLIADECKAIPDNIFEAVQGALTSEVFWRLYVSTPSTPTKGFSVFYSAFTRNRKNFKTHKVTAQESPRVSQKFIDMMHSEWGKDSQIVKARVNAEFPELAGDILIPLNAAEMFYDESADAIGPAAIGVDAARYGDDESAISVWKGDTLVYMKVFEKNSVDHLVNETIRVKDKFEAKCISVDDIGLGGGVTDGLARLVNSNHCSVVPFVYSKSPKDKKRFKQKGDQVLWEFAKDLRAKKIKSLVEDQTLVYQLASYKIHYTEKGMIKVKYPDRKLDRTSEEKSPDRADSCFIGWYASQLLQTGQDVKSSLERMQEIKNAASKELSTRFGGIREKAF